MFCNQCGRQIGPEDKFCPTCGRTVTQETSSQQNQNYAAKPVYSQSNSFGSLRSASQYVLYFILAIIILFVIALAMMDRISMVISAIIELVLFFGVYVPLKSGNKGSAAHICIGCAVTVALIGVYAAFSGALLFGLLDFAAAAMGFLAWNTINKK